MVAVHLVLADWVVTPLVSVRLYAVWPLMTPKWPLTSTKHNRILVLMIYKPPANYERQYNFLSEGIVFTKKTHLHCIRLSYPSIYKFLWCSGSEDTSFYRFAHFVLFWRQVSFDLHTKHYRILSFVLIMEKPHTKYENCRSYLSGDIVFTS